MNTDTIQKIHACPALPMTQMNCIHCGQEFTGARHELCGRPIFEHRACPACCEAHERRQREVERLKHEAQKRVEWVEMCPPRFFDTDLSRLPCDPATVNKVIGWMYGTEGLLLHGPTGTGKTRLAYHILERMHFHEGREVMAIPATEFCREVSHRFGKGWGEGERFIRRMIRVEVLFIDDLAKGRLTELVEAELFRVVDARCNHNRPTILTTNCNGAALSEIMSSDRAEPLLRRLREFFVAIAVLPEVKA